MRFYIKNFHCLLKCINIKSTDFIFSIKLVTVMHIHIQLYSSIPPKVLKEIVAQNFHKLVFLRWKIHGKKPRQLKSQLIKKQCIFYGNQTKYHPYVVNVVEKLLHSQTSFHKLITSAEIKWKLPIVSFL